MRVQGSANVDCVTVWFLFWKVKETVSPVAAVTLGGSNVSELLAPTLTWKVAAKAAAGIRAASANEGRMVLDVRSEVRCSMSSETWTKRKGKILIWSAAPLANRERTD